MKTIPVGSDIGKDKIDVCVEVRSKLRHKQFDNTLAGFQKLLHWLAEPFGSEQIFHVCMEATGAYWEAFATFLHAAGHNVSVVNPARTRAHAQSLMLRHKTDKIDAAVNLDFCATQKLDLWRPPAEEIKVLRALSRRRDDITHLQTIETNRLKSGALDAFGEESARRMLASFKQELKLINLQIKTHLKAHPKLAKHVQLLRTVKGIGLATAIKIVAELLDITQFKSARAVAASVGVTPAWRQSGTSLNPHPRMSKVGNADFRASLWWPTCVAMRSNPVIKAFANTLRAKNKPGRLIIVACMHKLLKLAYGVIHSDTPFDPYWGKPVALQPVAPT